MSWPKPFEKFWKKRSSFSELVVHEVLGIISAGIMGQLSMVNVQELLRMEWRNLL
jgi:hypothetical protein